MKTSSALVTLALLQALCICLGKWRHIFIHTVSIFIPLQLPVFNQPIHLLIHLAVQAQRAPSQAAQNFCRANKGKAGAVFAHEEYCDYYYECDEATDEPLLQACPNGLAFAGFRRGLTSNCDYPHRVACPDGTRVIGRK